jgi:hypothetical protein
MAKQTLPTRALLACGVLAGPILRDGDNGSGADPRLCNLSRRHILTVETPVMVRVSQNLNPDDFISYPPRDL